MSDVHQIECGVCKGTKVAPCFGCRGAGLIYIRGETPASYIDLELRIRWLEQTLEESAARHRRELALLKPTDRENELLAQNKTLEDQARLLRRELSIACEGNHQRNVELDALHAVWCDGGCAGGVHRFDKLGEKALSEEIVVAGEKAIARLRSWWENHKAKAARRRLEGESSAAPGNLELSNLCFCGSGKKWTDCIHQGPP